MIHNVKQYNRWITPDFTAKLLWLAALFLLLWPSIHLCLGNGTIVPADSLFSFAPYQAAAQEYRVAKPHIPLYSDLLLQNYPWWQFIHSSLADGELPLWNPYLFCGTPFLAKGQHLALYPLSLPFYLLPIEQAYGFFLVLHFLLAALTTTILAQTLGISRFGSLISGLVYGISGFMLARAVFPMIIAASAWLPLVLAMAECIINRQKFRGEPRIFLWILIGALALGFQALTGHPEILIYTLLTLIFYGIWRCFSLRGVKTESGVPMITFRTFVMLGIMIIFGIAIGAVQILPQYLVLQDNYRTETANFSQILDWSYPWQQLITLFLPQYFGNPAQYSYVDFFSGIIENVKQPISWGDKNFVEGAFYIGILPLLLVFIGMWQRKTPERYTTLTRKPSSGLYSCLLILSLCFVFGSPLYYAIYILPGMEQVHSPFRWVLISTVAASILAGYGVDNLLSRHKLAKLISIMSISCGLVILLLIFLTRFAFEKVELLWISFLHYSGGDPSIFKDIGTYISVQASGFIHCAFMLSISGSVILLALKNTDLGIGRDVLPIWKPVIVLIIAVDLMLFANKLYPDVDPKLLHHIPQIVATMKKDPDHWRFTTFDPESKKIMPANLGWLHNLQDIRGYDSIFSAAYRSYMETLDDQDELLFNRIAPLRSNVSLNSPLLDLLNVKYVLSEKQISNPRYSLITNVEGVLLYRNSGALPRAFTLPLSATVVTKNPYTALREYDPRHHLILAEDYGKTNSSKAEFTPAPSSAEPKTAKILNYSNNQVVVSVSAAESLWLVLADAFAEGWYASAQPSDKTIPAVNLHIKRAYGALRAVKLDPGEWVVQFNYRPPGLLIGFYLSVIIISSAGACLLIQLRRRT